MPEQKKCILILGAGVMQGPAIRTAKAMGLTAIAVDGDPNAAMAGEADRFEVIDLKDINKIEEFAKSLHKNDGLDGVMTAGTDFSASVAYVAERLGLPGIPYETALDASDKERMRGRFLAGGLPSPAFITFSQGSPLKLPFPFPAVVKPVDNMGSRGCRRVDNYAELALAVENALCFSRSGRAIAEEYMEGPEFSVDAVVYRGEITICGLADRHIFFPPYFIEMGHTMPTSFPPGDQEAILEVFSRGIKALGIENGAAKGDIKLTPRGPMIGEIAARLSGGYMSGWTYPYASGVNPVGGAIAAAIGQKPEGLCPGRDWTSAERAFISIPGAIASIEGLETAKAMPYIKDLFPRCETGRRMVFPENNVSKAGNVISAAPDRQTATQAAENAARAVLIRLAAPDEATDAFLAADSGFPPPAYTLDSALLEQLKKLPQTRYVNSSPLRLCGKNMDIIPFPAFMGSDLADYMGRGPRETLEAVRRLTGLGLPERENNAGGSALGREFWAALVRGGYQGAVYYIDKLFCRF